MKHNIQHFSFNKTEVDTNKPVKINETIFCYVKSDFTEASIFQFVDNQMYFSEVDVTTNGEICSFEYLTDDDNCVMCSVKDLSNGDIVLSENVIESLIIKDETPVTQGV